MLVNPNAVFAEGSKDLNKATNGGQRAYLLSTTTIQTNAPFPTLGTMKVWVREGETLYLGSSAQNVGNGRIDVRKANGFTASTGANTNLGKISSRNQEKQGPIGTGRYNAYSFTVEAGEGGVWEIDFISPDASRVTTYPTAIDVDDTWAQPNTAYIAAFDVSVYSGGVPITGRVFTNVFTGMLGTSSDDKFNAKLQVLTKDGYIYDVDNNGQAGMLFVFFANNKGFRDGSGNALYKSVTSTASPNVKDPRTGDSGTDITHKIFFNTPNADLSEEDITPDGTTTWLKEATVVSPIISNFDFKGNEGTSGSAGISPLTSYITFNTNQAGSYNIKLSLNGDNDFNDPEDRILTGPAVNDFNNIPWDGLNGVGNAVSETIVISTSGMIATLVSGEVHFPFLDVENNTKGMIITRTNGVGAPNNNVYWDDTSIGFGTSSLTGSSSALNGHKWSSDFGEERGLDTWTYVISAPVSPALQVKLKKADLQVQSLTSNKATYCIGETITYTLKIKNDGPDDVTGARVAFSFPSELTITSITPTPGITFTGATNYTAPFTDDPITASLDITNQAVLTVTITGTIDSKPTGTLDAKASILRPADVTDPDATNPDNAIPSDPLTECAAGTGCVNNNIATNTAAVSVSDISITAPAAVSEDDGIGSTTDMDFTVSLSAPNNGCAVRVDYTITDVTTDNGDFASNMSRTGTLTFATGITNQTITIPVKQDLMVEGDETFTVTISNPSSGGQLTIGTSTATGTITNDDAISTLAITKTDGTEGTANGSFIFSFPPEMSFDVPTVINYTLPASGTAVGGGTDYTAAGTAGAITIPAEANSFTLNLDVADDGLTEGDETVTITPGTITNTYTAVTPVTVTSTVPVVTITDDDYSTLTISNEGITEGDSGTQDLTFTVTLDNPTANSFDINYTTADGTATATEDYTAQSGNHTFNGSITGSDGVWTITIPVIGDKMIEADTEDFTVGFGLTSASNFGGHLTFVNSTVIGTITDNDSDELDNMVIDITAVNGKEIAAPGTQVPGVFTFKFRNGASTDKPTTISYTLSSGGAGEATNVLDYIGSGNTGTITIWPGDNSAELSLDVIDDGIIEGTENITLTVTNVSSSYPGVDVDGLSTSKTLAIEDNDFGTITITDATPVQEGDNGTPNALVFNVVLDKPTGSSFTIPFTLSPGTATAAGAFKDYNAPAIAFLTFAGTGPGSETQTISIPIVGDKMIEADETLSIALGTPSKFAGQLTVSGLPATGTIEDDDNNAGNKKILVTGADGSELSDPATDHTTFKFSFPPGVTADGDTKISYTLTSSTTFGIATIGADYTGSGLVGTVIIPAGQESYTLELPVVDDFIIEGDEKVDIAINGITNVNPALELFTVDPASKLWLNIKDNDNTVLLGSSDEIIEGDDGIKYAKFYVSLGLSTSSGFDVTFHTADIGSAIAGEDYVAKTETLHFDGNQETKEILVEINGDKKIEEDETFRVYLDDLTEDFGGALDLGDEMIQIIEDDDNIAGKKLISISKEDGAEVLVSETAEPGKFKLDFSVDGVTSDADTYISYTLSGNAQGSGTDYTNLTPGTLTIPAEAPGASFSLDVADDFIIEGPETVLITINSVTSANPNYDNMAAANSPVELNISDNDNIPANNIISVKKVDDGDENIVTPPTQLFRVSFPLGYSASVPTEVKYIISGTAANGMDYTNLSGTVIIPAFQNGADISVNVADDEIIENTETVIITLTAATNSISDLTLNPAFTTATADILDNDNVISKTKITLEKVQNGEEPGRAAQFRVRFPSNVTSSEATTVSYEITGGTAVDGTDYTITGKAPLALTGTVTIQAGDEFALITVPVIDDYIIEGTEDLLLKLTAATIVNIPSVSLELATIGAVSADIIDNDYTPGNNKITLAWAADGKEPSQNGKFKVSYPFGISSSVDTEVSYSIDASGTASAKLGAGFDYTISGSDPSTLSGTVTILAGHNSADIIIDVEDDKIIEETETVKLTLTSATNVFNPAVDGTPESIVITDDDNNSVNNVIVLTAGSNGSEPGTPGYFTVGFPDGYTSSAETTVKYIVWSTGTAIAGLDYTAADLDYSTLRGIVTIPANSGPVRIQIAVSDDDIIEGTETVAFILDGADNDIILSLATSPASPVSINIEDDEDDDPLHNVITLIKVDDGSESGAQARFRVSYPSGIKSSKETVITYTVGGNATEVADYAPLSRTVKIPAGDESADILITVEDDMLIELTENVELTLTGANNGLSTLTWTSGAVSADILDNDNNLVDNVIVLSLADNGSEPDIDHAHFKVGFANGHMSATETVVTYRIDNTGTATAGADYTIAGSDISTLTGTVTIPANTTSVNIEVKVLDDLVIEPMETVNLTLITATNSIPISGLQPAGAPVAATIADDDIISGNDKIYLDLVRNGIEGGDNPQFEVRFPAGYRSSEPTEVTYAVTGTNTADYNVDYTMPVFTVTIPAVINSALIEIPLTNDMILEHTESFQLVLTGATNSIAAGLTYQTSAERADIEDDDNVAANNVISLTKVTDGIEAGTPAVFKVSFPAGYINSVATTVNYTVTGGTAISGDRFYSKRAGNHSGWQRVGKF